MPLPSNPSATAKVGAWLKDLLGGKGALMKMLANSAESIPLWVGGKGEDAPQLCGAVPAESNYVATPGDMAAALVRSSDGDENWILSEVVSYSGSSGRYEVDDIDEEQKERHTLSRRKVIPLPTQRACPETNPEALYQPSTYSYCNSIPGHWSNRLHVTDYCNILNFG